MPSPEFERITRDAERHARAGRWDEAFSSYDNAFRHAFRQKDLLAMLGALYSTARVLWLSNQHDSAQEVAELGLEIAERGHVVRSVARFLNTLGVIRHAHEEWDAARDYYLKALEHARDEGDDQLVAGICPNLGAVANAMGDLHEARALYLEGIGACVRSGNPITAGNTYNNLGMVCADLEEWTESGVHFLRGIEIAEREGDLGLLARLLTGRAEPLIRTGELASARASLDRAEAIARQLDDPTALSDIERYRGMAARAESAHDRAEEHLERALAIATEAKLELERAECLEEMAHLRHAQGRGSAARATLREARRAYAALGAARDITRVDELRASWGAS